MYLTYCSARRREDTYHGGFCMAKLGEPILNCTVGTV